MAWRAAMAGLEAAIALCSALNAVVLLATSDDRRTAAKEVGGLVLALLFLGGVAESAILIAWLRSDDSQAFPAAAWVFARSLTFTGIELRLAAGAEGDREWEMREGNKEQGTRNWELGALCIRGSLFPVPCSSEGGKR